MPSGITARMLEGLLNALDWRELDRPKEVEGSEGGLYVTHESTLRLADADFRVYRLSDGSRIFDADDLERFFEEEAAAHA